MTKEDEFECREQLLIRGFGIFGSSGYEATNKINGFSPEYSSTSFMFLTALEVGIRTCSDWLKQFWNLIEINENSTSLKFRTGNTLMQGTQNESCHIWKYSTTRNLSMSTLMEEIKPVVFVKYDFQNREKSKLKCFLWKIRTIRILMQRRKTMVFYLNTRVEVLFFCLSFWLRKSHC